LVVNNVDDRGKFFDDSGKHNRIISCDLKNGRTGDVMKLRAIQDLRALRLCNPPALQLRRQGALYGPPLARGVFSVFDFYLKSIPILTDTTLILSWCKVTKLLCNFQVYDRIYFWIITRTGSSSRFHAFSASNQSLAVW
jgi:hypothetical protein